MRKVRVNTLSGFENVRDVYWITENGDVLSENKNMKPLKLRETKSTRKSKNRYLGVCLVEKGKEYYKRYTKVHKLVALAFVPNSESKDQINHIDQDGHNNHYSNLEWMSAKENSRFSNAKKVYCYDLNGLVKIYDAVADTLDDGFNQGHVASVCRGAIPKGRKHPILRHKGHVFSYEPMELEEVVQRLSKKRFFKPGDWRK